MNVIDLRLRGIWVSLSGTDDLEVRCPRPVTKEERELIFDQVVSIPTAESDGNIKKQRNGLGL